MKQENESNLIIEEDALFESNKLGPRMTSARATAIKYLFIHIFQSPPEGKWASMHLVSDIQKVKKKSIEYTQTHTVTIVSHSRSPRFVWRAADQLFQ
jgi:hypothetical protein